MNKIIQGKRYSTDGAKLICTYDAGDKGKNQNWYSESLYQKKTGEFFLHCTGGPTSKYKELKDGVWMNGEKLVPVSTAEAKEWAKDKLDQDDFEYVFRGEFIKPSLIRQRRTKRGISQGQLASMVGLSLTHIQRLEYGTSNIGELSARSFMAICDTLKIEPHALLESDKE